MLKTFKIITLALLLPLALGACSAGSGNYKHPTASSNPEKMSAETLCFRYAGAKHDDALAAEVAARGLDCFDLLEDDPLYTHDPSYDGSFR